MINNINNNKINISPKINDLEILASFLRKEALNIIKTADNWHVWWSLSSVELLTALYFWWLFRFDINNDKNPNRDRVLIRWHEWPIRYPIFALLWYIKKEELLTYRQLWSRLQWHEDMFDIPWVDITPSWSLWMLLSYWIWSAIENKKQWRNNKVIVFLGDWEEQEWNISEAARHWSWLWLDNLICIIDKNGKQLSRPTNCSDPNSNLEQIWKWYGWDVITINNWHDLNEILQVYKKLLHITKPTLVIAHTIKWYGVEWAEKHFSWYHTLSTIEDKNIISEAISKLNRQLSLNKNHSKKVIENSKNYVAEILSNEVQSKSKSINSEIFNIEYLGNSGDNLEKWQAEYFRELWKRILNIIDKNNKSLLYIITPDLLRKDIVEKEDMQKYAHFIDVWIREQHAIAMAHWISVENPESRIYMCYGDAFLYRAMDQINSFAQWKSNMLISWENSWVFQWQNWKTHQSIGQPWSLIYMPDIKVYEPADVTDLFNVYSKVLQENKWLSYVRLHRWSVMIERNNSDKKSTDSYYVYYPDKEPKFNIIASWFMLQNAVEVAKELEVKYRTPTSVINVVNHKTLNNTLPNLIKNNSPILTVYNWNPSILSNSVSSAILENQDIPRPKIIFWHWFIEWTSWKVDDLIKFYKLDKDWILDISLNILKSIK